MTAAQRRPWPVRITAAIVIAALQTSALAQSLPAPPTSPRPIVNYEYDHSGSGRL